MADTLPCWNVGVSYGYTAAAIQQAINDCCASGGGIVYLPHNPNPPYFGYLIDTMITVPAPANGGTIQIMGDGAQDGLPDYVLPVGGTRLQIKGGYENTDCLLIQTSNCYVEGLFLWGTGSQSGTGRGIVVGKTGFATTNVRLQDVIIRNISGYALDCGSPTDPSVLVTGFVATRCEFRQCNAPNQSLVRVNQGCSQMVFDRCQWADTKYRGIELLNCSGIAFRECDFEEDNPTSVATTQPLLYATGATNVLVEHCWFEEHMPLGTLMPFIQLKDACHAWSIIGCNFARAINTDSSVIAVGTSTASQPSRSIVVMNPFINLGGAPTNNSDVRVLAPDSEVLLVGGVTRGNGQVYQVRLVDDSPTTTSQRSCALGGSSRVGLPRMTSAAASAMANSGLVKPGSMIWRQDIGTTHEIDVWSNVSGAWAWKRLQTYIP